jgi:hypothetical protein
MLKKFWFVAGGKSSEITCFIIISPRENQIVTLSASKILSRAGETTI